MKENKRILIVDDNEAIHEDFKKIFDDTRSHTDELDLLMKDLDNDNEEVPQISCEFSYEFFHAYQGEEAFNMVKDAENKGMPFALLLMDVRMPPGWDGVMTVKKIWNEFPHNEVIICTAYSDCSLSSILDELGISDQLQFLYKPFDVITIRQMVLAKVKKWNLALANRLYTKNLEEMVAKRTKTLNLKIKDLEKASREITKLKTILPMCAWCHKIRDDDNYWQKVDEYLSTHSKTEISHGICPECYEKVVSKIDKDVHVN